MANYDPDFALALLLQAKYNKESAVASKSNKENKENAVSSFSKSVHKSVSNSLVDPIWETTDPTPDIHALFIAFNKRFFYGSLDSVEVTWSSRMTNCAGVCSYQNRSGFCSIRLSAPLLKLRPRSDLVETLLHEMIHAYLFVSNNDRDRDGHGPIFQSHMHRINREAGTKITIYHSFHDEVELYKQHWWRCNGICQQRKPYYGFVKRSMNRKPGPNDIWWTEHQATCGGTFIKVKEPEGFQKNKTAKVLNKKTSPNSMITGFFKTNVNSTSFVNKVGNEKSQALPIGTQDNLRKVQNSRFTSNNTASGYIVKDFKNSSTQSSSSHLKNPIKPGANIHGFQGSSNGSLSTGAVKKMGNSNTKDIHKNKSNPGSMLANRGSGTLVVTGREKNNVVQGTKTGSPVKPNFVPFSGSGYILDKPTKDKNKFNSKLLNTKPQHFTRQDSYMPKTKQPKLECIPDVIEIIDDNLYENCPVCNVAILKEEMETHLKTCIYLAPSDEFSEDIWNSNVSNNLTNETCTCPVCNLRVSRSEMNSHFDGCLGLSTVFNDSSTLDDSGDEDESSDVNCPCCDKKIKEIEINKHLDECLNMMLISKIK
uniref:Protein with SprT-like domain at the N terminus n=1 Tax=Clastoptera arizonana TaxID=38151 RepID=A0A1B6DH22_9HEMI